MQSVKRELEGLRRPRGVEHIATEISVIDDVVECAFILYGQKYPMTETGLKFEIYLAFGAWDLRFAPQNTSPNFRPRVLRLAREGSAYARSVGSSGVMGAP